MDGIAEQNLSRRDFLLLSGAAIAGGSVRPSLAARDERSKRVAEVFAQYDAQGIHRTGTPADLQSARWLAEKVRDAGQEPRLIGFPHSRIDVLRAEVRAGDRRVEGLPLFDSPSTGAGGVTGRIGSLESGAAIGVGMAPPGRNSPDGRSFDTARRQNAFQALVRICTKSRWGNPAGITPINAEDFREPFGPPA
ncbi:hypothetical protein IIC65_00765, partial [Candidatus Sumerlaeota bacterium]|nr:hypothetical protein [Candidatus Sumerlaeota bacterium]